MTQEHHETKSEIDQLKQLCAKNQIDTSSRKQKEEHKDEQCVVKGGRSCNSSTVVSATQYTGDDVATGADA